MVTATYIGKLIIDSLSYMIQTSFFKVIVFFLCFEKTVSLLNKKLW